MNNSLGKFLGGRDLKPCAVCSRRFTPDRVDTHEAICQKSSATTRKLFDVSQQRIGGTEFEKSTKNETEAIDQKLKKGPSSMSTNWRQKHAEFIEAVRRSKNLEAGKDKCGKVKDLPLAPVLNCDDYVQCPHCLRQFNPNAAERHIFTCGKVMQERSISKDCISRSNTNLSEVNVAEK